jgi:hypothetical protein
VLSRSRYHSGGITVLGIDFGGVQGASALPVSQLVNDRAEAHAEGYSIS